MLQTKVVKKIETHILGFQ